MSHLLSSHGFPVTAAEAGQSGQQQQEEEGDTDAQDQTKNQGLIISPSFLTLILTIPFWD